jgi:hypothetical protein
LALIAGLTALGLLGLPGHGYAGAGKGLVASISKIGAKENVLVARIPLTMTTKYQKIAVEGPLGVTIVEVNRLRVRVLDSPCKDRVCVHFGWLDSSRDFAACLPNRVLVTVEAAE